MDTITNNSTKMEYQQMLAAFGFAQQNTSPTRVTNKTQKCIDQIHFNCSDTLLHITLPVAISDHYPVFMEIPH